MKTQQTPSAIRPPKPDTFDGRHSDTFIYSMEKLFEYHGENDSKRRVALAVTYLRGSALRWYKGAERQDNAHALKEWPAFILAIKHFFEAANTETIVRNKLANLRQTASVAKYNDQFNSLVIEIIDLDSNSKLDMYMRGLKPQVQLHVTLKDPSNLETAQRVALNVDGILMQTGTMQGSQQRDTHKFRNNKQHSNNRHGSRFGRSSNGSSGSQSTPMELGQAEDEQQQDEYEQHVDSSVAAAQSNYKGNNRLSPEQQRRLMAEGRCFLCTEHGHLARECPHAHRNHQKKD